MNKKILFALFTILIFLAACIEVEETTTPTQEKSQVKEETKATPTATTETKTEEKKTEVKVEEKKETPKTEPKIEVKEEKQGNVVFGVTDKAVNLRDLSSVKIKVTGASVHKRDEDKWVPIVVETGNELDLLQLKNQGVVALVAEGKVPVGEYNQLRLTVSKPDVLASNEIRSAEMPTTLLKIVADLNVQEGATSTAVFDFFVDKSVHITNVGRYLFAPVIKVETKTDAQVNRGARRIDITGGSLVTSKTVGMKADGHFEDGEVSLDPTKEISYANGVIKEGGDSTRIEKPKYYKK